MQLILETEASADIIVKMSTVEESLETNLRDSIASLKNDIGNGNKENIECQKNVISNNDVFDADLKELSDDHPQLPSTAQHEDKDINKSDTAESTAEDVKLEVNNIACEKLSSDKNSYESTNNSSKHKNDIMNGDRPESIDNADLAEKDGEDKVETLVDNLVMQQSINNSVNSEKISTIDVESEKSEIEEHTERTIANSNNKEVVEKVLDTSDPELKLVNELETVEEKVAEVNETSEEANQVDDDISEIAHQVDDMISDLAMQIDEDDLQDAEVKDISSNECSKAENGLQNVIQVDLDSELKTSNENIVDLDFEEMDEKDCVDESKQSKSEVNAVKELISENTPKIVPPEQSRDETDVVEVKTDINELETKITRSEHHVEETREIETEAKIPDTEKHSTVESEPETEKMEDEAIQIETEQDREIVENIESVANENDLEDKNKTEVETSDNEAKGSPSNIISEAGENKLAQSREGEMVVLDVDEIKEKSEVKQQTNEPKAETPTQSVKPEIKLVPILKLSNTLDILSDDEEDIPQPKSQNSTETIAAEKPCINIEDDDDIMLIDEEMDLKKDSKKELVQTEEKENKTEEKCSSDVVKEESSEIKKNDETVSEAEQDPVVTAPEVKSPVTEMETANIKEAKEEIKETPKPLLPENFLKSCKKNLNDMTRDELEEFCIVKIVESIVDRSNLGEIKSKLKSMAQNIEEYKKKAMMLTKQNRDLQLVLKSVQEEQKKKSDTAITPLKITRSVGMQVLMTEKIGTRKKPNNTTIPIAPSTANRNIRTPSQSPRAQKPPAGNQQIPVPRLVPAAANPVAKSPVTQNSPINTQVKAPNFPNGARISPIAQKAEKRTHNRTQSDTVDLTDDEPPTKVTPRSSPAPPVRVVPHQLANTRPQLPQALNSPRKVYIPISGPQGNIRPGQTIMLKSVASPGPRQRCAIPNLARAPAPNQVRRPQNNRHPAPLPDAMKQYQPPNWKALPPAPDLKLSKVENGIVISWKIEGYQEDSYEDIASYQLYAYQETSSPPSTSLWKKIGDVKALPLPMACTLTQFMAGYKYYFAVRAVDVRSRLGPFSLPGSILLLNKM